MAPPPVDPVGPNINPTIAGALIGLAGILLSNLIGPVRERLAARAQRRREASAAATTAQVDREKLASGDYQWIITDLRAEIKELRDQMRDFNTDREQWRKIERHLRNENDRLKDEVAELRDQNAEQATQLATLRGRVASLEAGHPNAPLPPAVT